MLAQTSLFSVLCFVVAALMGAVGQFLYKSGADLTDATWQSYLLTQGSLVALLAT